ncbi:acyl transferase [Amycolatopsis vancoresmycina DSM 44592]|uniref:Acyl transferase n=1 Tax=Amycolatopsis vancoresmycina DSM 44592 TaxID=1292037 RepID=R1FFR1_9PSEU|nr:acyl transferase [Amycolatopsis vancoresmycina DSM 44592]
MPPTLHAGTPSAKIDWTAGAVELLQEGRDWTADRPRRGAVSSFGISGTNAHLILEEAPAPPASPVNSSGLVPWVLSAKSAEALREQAARLSLVDGEPADVAFSLATTRSAFAHRAVVVGADRERLLAGVRALADGTPAPHVVSGVARNSKVALVFPGQGAQWTGMATELLATSEVFAARFTECARALEPYTGFSLLDEPELDRVDVVQPALFAMMVSLAELWAAHGVRPDAVIGHSQGEIAAAVVSGALSLEDGARVVALRSKAILALAGAGGMVSVAASRARTEELAAPWGDRIGIAAVNGPEATVVSGEPGALDEFMAACAVRTRRIPVDYASHSVQVEQLRDELLDVLGPITPRAAGTGFFSTVIGDWIDGTELDAEYWYTNLRSTVRLDIAVERLKAEGFGTFVEASPHPVLTMAIGDDVVAAPGADHGDRRRRRRAGLVASRRRRPRSLRAVGGRSARPRRQGGLDVVLRRRFPRRSAHLRLPAAALLAEARRPRGRRSGELLAVRHPLAAGAGTGGCAGRTLARRGRPRPGTVSCGRTRRRSPDGDRRPRKPGRPAARGGARGGRGVTAGVRRTAAPGVPRTAVRRRGNAAARPSPRRRGDRRTPVAADVRCRPHGLALARPSPDLGARPGRRPGTPGPLGRPGRPARRTRHPGAGTARRHPGRSRRRGPVRHPPVRRPRPPPGPRGAAPDRARLVVGHRHRPGHRRHRRPRPADRRLAPRSRRRPRHPGQPPWRPGPGRPGYHLRRLRRRQPRRRRSPGRSARHPGRRPRRRAHRTGLGRRHRRRRVRRRRPRQGARRRKPGRRLRPRPRRVRPVLLHRRGLGQRRPRGLRRRQRPPRRPRPAPARPRPAGHLAGLGRLERRQPRQGEPGLRREPPAAPGPAVPRPRPRVRRAAPGARRRRHVPRRGRRRLGPVRAGVHRPASPAAARRAARGPPRADGGKAAGQAGLAGRSRPGRPSPGRARAGPRHRGGGARPRRPGRRRPRRRAARTGLRLAHRGRAAQPPRRRNRPEPARDPRLRPPDGRAHHGVPAGRPGEGHRDRRRGRRRRADRHRGDELPLPGWHQEPRGPLGAHHQRRRRDHRVPGRPRLGRRGAVRPRPRPRRHQLHPPRRLPARRGRLRPGLLRHLAARSPDHGPAAAPAAGDVVGSDGTRRRRPGKPAGQRHRRVRRHQLRRLRHRAGPAGQLGRAPAHRRCGQRRLRPDLLHLRTHRPGRHGRHGVLVVPGRAAPGLPVAAHRRVHDGAGRRGGADVDAGVVRRLQPPARARRRRPLQGVLRRRRRHGHGRGRRRPAGRTARRRPAERPRGARRDPRLGGQPGRRVQRPDRPQRPRAAAGHPPGRGQRPADLRRRRRRRGPRHRHHPRRPDRGAGPAGHLRPRPRHPVVARLGEVQHRAQPGRLRRRRRDQAGPVPAPRRPPGHAARGHAVVPCGLVGRERRTADGKPAVARNRPPAPGRGVVVRHERHQRARGPRSRTGAGRGGAVRARRDRPGALGPVREDARFAGRAGTAAAGARRGRTGGPGRRCGVLPGEFPVYVRATGGARDHRRGRRPRPAGRARPRPGRSRPGAGQRPPRGQGRLRLSRAGLAVGGDGFGPDEHVAGVRGPHAGLRTRAGAVRRVVAARSPGRRRAAAARRRRAARAVRRDGVAGRSLARPRGFPGRRDRPLPGRDRRGRGRRRTVPRGRGPCGRVAQQGDPGPGRTRWHGVGGRRPRDRRATAHRRPVDRGGQRPGRGGGVRFAVRARRADRVLRGRRHPREAGPGGLRVALRPGRSDRGRAA